MKKIEWKKKYIDTLINNGVDKKFAKAVFDAGDCKKFGHDYDDDPEDCALSEMSYWEE